MHGAMPSDLMAADYGTATDSWANCCLSWSCNHSMGREMHEGGGDWVLQFPMPWYVGQ